MKLGSDLRQTPFRSHFRTQLSQRTDPKVRPIWGAPFHTTLIEGLIAAPIIKNLMKEDTPIYIGKSLFRELPYDIRKDLEDSKYIYCLDWSRFDSSVNSAFLQWFFDYLEEVVRFPDTLTSNSSLHILINTVYFRSRTRLL